MSEKSPFQYKSLLKEFKGCSFSLDNKPNLSPRGKQVIGETNGCIGTSKPLEFIEDHFVLFCRMYDNSKTNLVQVFIENNSNTIKNNSETSSVYTQTEVPLPCNVNEISKIDKNHIIVSIGKSLDIWKRTKHQSNEQPIKNQGFLDSQCIHTWQENSNIFLIEPIILSHQQSKLNYGKNESIDEVKCLIGTKNGISCLQLASSNSHSFQMNTKIFNIQNHHHDIVTSMKWNSHQNINLFSSTWDEGMLKLYDIRCPTKTSNDCIASQFVQKGLFDHDVMNEHYLVCGGLEGIIHLYDKRFLNKPLSQQLDPFMQDIYEISSSSNSKKPSQNMKNITNNNDNNFNNKSSSCNEILCFGSHGFTLWDGGGSTGSLNFKDVKLHHSKHHEKSMCCSRGGFLSNTCQIFTCNNKGYFQLWDLKPSPSSRLISKKKGVSFPSHLKINRQEEERIERKRDHSSITREVGVDTNEATYSSSAKKSSELRLPSDAAIERSTTSLLSVSRKVNHEEVQNSNNEEEWDWDIDFEKEWNEQTLNSSSSSSSSSSSASSSSILMSNDDPKNTNKNDHDKEDKVEAVKEIQKNVKSSQLLMITNYQQVSQDASSSQIDHLPPVNQLKRTNVTPLKEIDELIGYYLS